MGLCILWVMGDDVWTFSGYEHRCGCSFVMLVAGMCGGVFCMCFVGFVYSSLWPASCVGDVLDEGGHLRIQFPSEDVS